MVNALRDLEAFVKVAGGPEGLSRDRLILLTDGLARCADRELRATAEKCQVERGN